MSMLYMGVEEISHDYYNLPHIGHPQTKFVEQFQDYDFRKDTENYINLFYFKNARAIYELLINRTEKGER